ncbi:MAG: HipA family kinase [Gemmatimonadaceae bacterium]
MPRLYHMHIVDAQRILSADHRGSSWPVLADADGGPWFTKLRGSGQGTGALVAEVIVGALAEAIGLNVPPRVLVRIPPAVESVDRDGELRWLLDSSVGLNLGFAFLAGARDVAATQIDMVNRDDAAAIVWLDGLVMNPDRTARNPNLLWWRDKLWLIDHGAALGFQYQWSAVSESTPALPTPGVELHLLHERVADLAEWDEIFAARLTREVVDDAVAQVPNDFLARDDSGEWLRRRRAAYAAFLWKRLKAPRSWVGAGPAGQHQPRRGPPSWLVDR